MNALRTSTPWGVVSLLRKPSEPKARLVVRRIIWRDGKPESEYLRDSDGQILTFDTLGEAKAAVDQATGNTALRTPVEKPNFDDLRRMREEALAAGAGSGRWIKCAQTFMDHFPSIYDTAKAMNADAAQRHGQLRVLVDLLQEALGPLEVSAALVESENTADVDVLIARIKSAIEGVLKGQPCC